MQNPIQNLDKALLFSRNQVFCLKIWKVWRAPTTPQFSIFAETLHTFLTYQCLQKGLVSALSFFTFFLVTQDLNKIKRSQTPFCRYLYLIFVSALLNLYYQIIEKLVSKNQFHINHASHLNESFPKLAQRIS